MMNFDDVIEENIKNTMEIGQKLRTIHKEY